MCSAPSRKLYPSDVSDDEWLLAVPSPTWMTEAAPQRDHSMRELFNALRSMIRHGITWHAMPNDFLPWAAVCLGLSLPRFGGRFVGLWATRPRAFPASRLRRLLATDIPGQSAA